MHCLKEQKPEEVQNQDNIKKYVFLLERVINLTQKVNSWDLVHWIATEQRITKLFDILAQFPSENCISSTHVGAVRICVLLIVTNVIYQINFFWLPVLCCLCQKWEDKKELKMCFH